MEFFAHGTDRRSILNKIQPRCLQIVLWSCLGSVLLGSGCSTNALIVNSTNPPSGVQIQVTFSGSFPGLAGHSGTVTTPATVNVASGDTAKLTAPATAPGGNNFAHWTGCNTTSGTTCEVMMNVDRHTTAVYGPPPPPILNSVNPPSGTQNQTVAVTLTGSNFISGATVSVSGTGVTVQNVVVVSDIKISANFVIAVGAATGLRDVTVTTSSGSDTKTGAFTVNAAAPSPPSITTASVPDGIVGTAYTSTTLLATGGTSPYTWDTFPPGTPPAPGLTLSAGGTISGTPTAPGGMSSFTTKVTDSSTPTAQTATKNFSLTVNQAPTVTSANNAAFTEGTAGTFTVTATGFPTPTLSETVLPPTVALPNGVAFAPGSGLLSGTPAAGTAGTYNIQFTASNGVGTNAVQNFTLTVSAPAPPVVTATAGTPQSTQINTVFTTPLKVTVTRGGIPVSGAPVTFTVNPAANGASGAFPGGSTDTQPTNSLGVATSNTITANGTPGTYTETATVGGATTPATFALTNTCSNSAALCGAYALLFQGFEGTNLSLTNNVVIGGSFVVDLSGNVISGVEDINRPAGVTLSLPITGGSATTIAPNRHVLLLTTSQGTSQYHFTMASQTAPGSQKGALIEFDDLDGTGTRGSGFLQKQSPTFFSLSSIAGDKIVGLSGYYGASGHRIAAVGRFTLDGGTGAISNGLMDVTEQNATSATSGALTLTGTFSAPDPATGRGTATLTLPAGNGFFDSANFVYYIVPASAEGTIILVPSDTRSATTPTLSGRLGLSTSTPFGNFSLTANQPIIFVMEGAAPSVAVGQMVTNGSGGLTSGTLDQNDGGVTTSNSPFSAGGTYTVEPSGRTKFTFTAGSITKTQVAYLTRDLFAASAFIMDAQAGDVQFGEFKFQSLIFPPSGTFRAGSFSPAEVAGENVSGLATLANPNFTLDVDLSPGPLGGVGALSDFGTYSAASGRGKATLGTRTVIFWIITSTEFVGFSETSLTDPNPTLLHFVQ